MFTIKKADNSNASNNVDNKANDQPGAFEVPSVVMAMAEKLKGGQMPDEINRDANAEGEPTVLSAGTVFKGVMSSPGPVHAKGKLEGEVSAPHFTLSSTGELKGKLMCKKLVIDGEFDGDLVCEQAFAGADAVLSGNLVCKSLQAAPGAAINGKVQIGS